MSPRGFLLLALALPITVAMAITAEQKFDKPEQQALYDRLGQEVRCLVCQNQTIGDSSAPLASDLRREIRRMLEEGMTDEQIFDFLVQRYGEFALYRPRTSGKTLVLWAAPVVLLLGGALLLWRILRQRMALPINDEQGEEA